MWLKVPRQTCIMIFQKLHSSRPQSGCFQIRKDLFKKNAVLGVQFRLEVLRQKVPGSSSYDGGLENKNKFTECRTVNVKTVL